MGSIPHTSHFITNIDVNLEVSILIFDFKNHVYHILQISFQLESSKNNKLGFEDFLIIRDS
jgi:hypothetical protein